MAAETRLIYEFDDFQLEPNERKLLRRGEVIPLHGKAFELLLALIRNRGRLLTKDELFELVWPDQIVEESNLTVNMSAIRRALGERAASPRYITTVSGRGYRFNADVRHFADEALTIERETFARVVVEQEETESRTSISQGIRRLTSHPLLLLTVCLLMLTIGATGFWVRVIHRTTTPVLWANLSLHHFPTHGGVPFRAVISRDGKSIVYRQRLNGKDSLWLGEVASNTSVMIDEQPDVLYASLAVSADGANVYSAIREGRDAIARLVRMPIVGGVMTEIAANVLGPVASSPDSRQVAFLRRDDKTKQTSIVIVDADGKNERTLVTRAAPHTFSGYGLSWSPDGQTIAIGANDDKNGDVILAVNVADGSVTRIGSYSWGGVGAVCWMPDGRGLALTASENAITRRWQIWFVSYPDGQARKITNDVEMYLPASVSVTSNLTIAAVLGHNTYGLWVAPDGEVKGAHLALQGVEPRYEGVDGLTWTADGSLLYSAYADDAQVIWKIAPDGTSLRQLTSNTANHVDREMSATSDGRYIVFQSNRSGEFQIWRANADGSNLKQLTSDGANYQPSVSPDGQWILYRSNRRGRPSLWRISIEGGAPAELSDKVASWPEVSPDGKYIAYLESFDSPETRLAIMPVTGGADLKTFEVPGSVYSSRRLHWTPDGQAVVYPDSIRGLWRQSLTETKPRPYPGFEEMLVSQFAWSRDGRNLVYTRATELRDIVLLDNSK